MLQPQRMLMTFLFREYIAVEYEFYIGSSRRSHPAQYVVDRFGPPTLERSGSEHQAGRFPSSSSQRGEDRDERWSLL